MSTSPSPTRRPSLLVRQLERQRNRWASELAETPKESARRRVLIDRIRRAGEDIRAARNA